MSNVTRIQRLSSFLLLFTLCACCGPINQFVLLPSPDGHTGKVAVTSKGGTVTLTKAFESTALVAAHTAPFPPALMSEGKVNQIFKEAMEAHPPAPVTYLLYFVSATSRLTQESEMLLPEILAHIRRANSTDISISGHSDRLGKKDFNIIISRERADVVARWLIEKGIPRESLQVASYGMELPLIDTPEGVSEPRNRRVEIVVR